MRLQAGDYLQLTAELTAYAIALTRDRDMADDLVQDIAVKIFEGRPLPQAETDRKRYAFRMLRNQHLDNLRKKKIRAEYLAEQERYSVEYNDIGSNSEERLIVRDAFGRLSPEHREVLFLVDVMGFKYAEAAGMIGVAVGTIMSRVSRARAEMARQLQA